MKQEENEEKLKQVTIRLQKSLIIKLKEIARKKRIPYQQFIRNFLNDYVDNQNANL